MLATAKRNFGRLQGTIYDFPETGDTLPMHNHDENSVHITIVSKGSFRVHGNDFDITIKAGDVVEIGRAHV